MCQLRRCSGEFPVSQSRMPLGKRSVTHPIREYGGEIFTNYYFGEANTANNTGNHHNNAINENFNWGGISGLLQKDKSLTKTTLQLDLHLYTSSVRRIFLQDLKSSGSCFFRISSLQDPDSSEFCA